MSHLVDREGLELGGTELFERHALVLEVNASDGQSDASGLATGGDSEVVEYSRHGDAGVVVVRVWWWWWWWLWLSCGGGSCGVVCELVCESGRRSGWQAGTSVCSGGAEQITGLSASRF